jgi:hypothetical protein
MATTFLKRQKEMKRLEKQREKAEKRAQRKIASKREKEFSGENPIMAENEDFGDGVGAPGETAPED